MEKVLLVLSHIHPGMCHDKTDECPICRGNYLGQTEYETKKQKNRTHLFTSVTPLENELKSTRNAKTKGFFTFPSVSPSIQIQVELLAASLHLERLEMGDVIARRFRQGQPVSRDPNWDILLLTLSSGAFQIGREEVENALRLVSQSKRSVLFVEGAPAASTTQREGFLRLKQRIHQMSSVVACGLLFPDTFSLLKCLNFIKKQEGRCTFVQLLGTASPVSHFVHIAEGANGHLGVPLFM